MTFPGYGQGDCDRVQTLFLFSEFCEGSTAPRVLLSVRTFSMRQLPSKVHASIATGQQALEVSCHSIRGQTEAWNLSRICFFKYCVFLPLFARDIAC